MFPMSKDYYRISMHGDRGVIQTKAGSLREVLQLVHGVNRIVFIFHHFCGRCEMTLYNPNLELLPKWSGDQPQLFESRMKQFNEEVAI